MYMLYCSKSKRGDDIIPKSSNQKLKLFYLLRILYEKSNEDNRLSAADLIKELSFYDVTAERKSIYADLEALRSLGFDVCGGDDNVRGNYLGERYFQLSEVKMLIDVIQASNFISEKKSLELIEKLGHFVSEHDRKSLRRQIVLANRIKSSNEAVYYSIDNIHRAIDERLKIRFKYYNIDTQKKKVYRNNGEYYIVNPIALMWDDEKYYLVAFDDKDGKLKNYRVDKMDSVSVFDEKISENAINVHFDAAECSRQSFNMFSGNVKEVTLVASNSASSIIYDRFGTDVFVIPNDNDTFCVTVNVAVSPQFYSWIFGVSEFVSIKYPSDVVAEYSRMCERVLKQNGQNKHTT